MYRKWLIYGWQPCPSMIMCLNHVKLGLFKVLRSCRDVPEMIDLQLGAPTRARSCARIMYNQHVFIAVRNVSLSVLK